jgi:hypothetical protein
MPHPTWYTYKLVDQHTGNVRAYEHELSVLLPYRRYLRNGQPQLVVGSPSVVILGEETRHGTELAVRRVSYYPTPNADLSAELRGELAECWVFLARTMSTSVDPRWDAGSANQS